MAEDQMWKFIEGVKAKLFEPEHRRLQSLIDRLVDQSEEVTKSNERGFMFNGEIYRHSRSNIIHKRWPALAYHLIPEMEKWVKDKKQLELDQAQIGQILFKLQSAVMHYGPNGREYQLQEMRDALPECLVPLVPQFRGLSRVSNVQFFLRHERDMRQYTKLLPKMEMYAVTGLIY